MTMWARSLAEHKGYARLISKEEAKEVLQLSYESNLVQIRGKMSENTRAFYLQLLRMLLRSSSGCETV